MANLPESSQWETGIYQIEQTDPVQGGTSGISNRQAKQLANRTKFLDDVKAGLESPGFTGVPTSPTAATGTNTLQIANMAALYNATVGFGVGASQAPQITNLNSAVSGGLYRYDTGATNAPLSTTAGMIFVSAYSALYVSQVVVTVQLTDATLYNRTFTRTMNNGSWGAWKEIASLTGVTNATNAPSGQIGEVITNQATGVALTSGSVANLTSVSLTPGDWDVSGTILLSNTGSNIVVSFGGLNTTSATMPAFPNLMRIETVNGTTSLHNTVPSVRFNISATTTIYLIGQANSSAGTNTGSGFIRARRVR